MAKKKSANAEDSFFADMAATTGGITLDTAGTVPYFIDTGNLSLNYMNSGKFIHGGIPGGRITEVKGPPATSKSLLGYSCLGSCQRMKGISVLLDCERAGNADFAQAAGHVDPSRLITYEPISIQQVEAKILVATKAIRKHYGTETPILFVWDSIGVTPTDREWKETELPENPTQAQIKAVGLERPGERARAAGDLLRKMNPFMNEQNATLFVINQTRKAIGTYGTPNIGAGGGEALKFFASCRMDTNIGKMIESKKGLPLGVNLRFANKKSRSFVPGLKTEGVQLFFETGINPLGGLLSILVAAGRIDNYSGSHYRVLEPWADGKDVTFQAAKGPNTIPLDVLFEAPRLVDGETEEEVRAYLAPFDAAIRMATGDNIVEKKSEDDDEVPDFISSLKKDDDEDE